MDSWPQLARCFAAAWRGLTDDERHILTAGWGRKDLRVVTWLKTEDISQVDTPLWSVTHPLTGEALVLVSVKTDYLGDLPVGEEKRS